MSDSLRHDEDVVLAKASIVRACLRTIREVGSKAELDEWIRRDLEVLNLQRAVQACLDLAHHLIAANRWELPRDGGHAMSILSRRGVVDHDTAETMQRVIGFRNVAVHLYTEIDPDVVEGIVSHRLGDLERYVGTVLNATVKAG